MFVTSMFATQKLQNGIKILCSKIIRRLIDSKRPRSSLKWAALTDFTKFTGKYLQSSPTTVNLAIQTHSFTINETPWRCFLEDFS